jgi:hypothetical protein
MDLQNYLVDLRVILTMCRSDPMTIIEDTRQQRGKYDEAHAWFKSEGIHLVRSKLAVGDYCLAPNRSIDTKKGFEELVGNFCSSDRARVKREILNAKEMGVELIFLVIDETARSIEDARTWENEYGRVSGETLYKTLDTFTKRYGVRFEFCTREELGATIKRILTEEGHDE